MSFILLWWRRLVLVNRSVDEAGRKLVGLVWCVTSGWAGGGYST